MNYIDLKTILKNQYEKGKFCKYDIIIRYLFVKEFYKQNKPDDFKYKLYSKLSAARGIKDRSKRFIKLIDSFEKKGYDKKYPLEFSKDYHICGGTHRIAICLYLDINEIPFIKNESCKRKRRRFNKKWLEDNGFQNNMQVINRAKNKLFKTIGIVE